MMGRRRDDAATPGSGPRRVASRPPPIRFGTSGWRGRLGEEVTFPRARVLARSVADWLRETGLDDRVLIGWDGRFASADLAEATAHVLLEQGLSPVVASDATPTPAITHALAMGRGTAGLVWTASHNPPSDHGLKVFGGGGAAILDRDARRIESLAAARMADDTPAARQTVRTSDFSSRYREDLLAALDVDALRRSDLVVHYDAMHGTGGGVLDAILTRAGIEVEAMRTERDPRFGGGAPDPSEASLAGLAARVRAGAGLRIGLATDGDADRFGVVDGTGRVLSETQVIALLLDRLATRGLLGRGVALSIGTGSLVERVAAEHGLSVERHPVGFKHLSQAIASDRVDFAGEESGGFAYAKMGCDKDGILAGCLLAELVADSGIPIEAHIARLEARHGASACGRIALPVTPDIEAALSKLRTNPPATLDRVGVVAIDDRSGLHFSLSDGGFLMLRRSGTEDVMRVYAEARDAEGLQARLKAGRRLVD